MALIFAQGQRERGAGTEGGASATYLCAQDFGGVADAADDAHAAGVGDGSSELRACRDVHALEVALL